MNLLIDCLVEVLLFVYNSCSLELLAKIIGQLANWMYWLISQLFKSVVIVLFDWWSELLGAQHFDHSF